MPIIHFKGLRIENLVNFWSARRIDHQKFISVVMNIISADDIKIKQRWEEAKVSKGIYF